MATTLRPTTGSHLLGRDLRRLRGSRKLQDVAALSSAGALAGPLRPLSVAALSEIENGKYLPSLDALITLCITYRISPARLVRRVLEDRLVSGQPIPDEDADVERGAVSALRDGQWVRALALVVAGAERAKDDADRLRWRLRHAAVLSNIGMIDQALNELQETLDSPELPKTMRPRVHLDLANAASRAGHFTLASFHCQAALDEAEGAPEHERAFRVLALQTSVALAIRRSVQGAAGERELRVALHRVEEARALTGEGDRHARACLDLYHAQIHDRLGSRAQAHELYRRLETECEALGSTHLHACVLVSHAELLASGGGEDAARRKLQRAAQIATDCHAVDHAFEAHFLLLSLARSERERELHRRSCRKFLSLATHPTPRMREFDSLADGDPS
jgi:tetratricopeptide (TPR) repeat protein